MPQAMPQDIFFEKDYEIKYYEQNLNGDLKESALMNFLQDIATLSAEKLGFGPSFVFKNNYAWVVLRYRVEFYGELKNLTKITIKTEPRGLSRLYAFRDFEIFAPDGTCLAKATSTWSLIDMESRRLLPMQKVLPMMFAFEKRESDLEYSKTGEIENPQYEKTFDVRFDDIDVNRHANNSNYVVWALETLEPDFRKNYCVKNLDIRYKKEIGLGEKVISIAQKSEQGGLIQTAHSIKNTENNDSLCEITIEWKNTSNSKI